MKILITGATGLIGKYLANFLTAKGHQITQLSRHSVKDGIYWDPQSGQLDFHALEGFDAFINLAGESILGRWTEIKKNKILESRIQTTQLLCKAISQLQSPPQVLINASATGFYGNREDCVLDESTSQGKGFLADICNKWEKAALQAKERGVRVVLLRIGVVLAKEGGFLSNIKTPFMMGLGGRMGNGRQYMSWVSVNELSHMIDFILKNKELEGPINAVAPRPVTNLEFTKALGKVINRPTILPFPAFAARMVFGELADELMLASARVHPTKLQKSGYIFIDPDLESTLKQLINS